MAGDRALSDVLQDIVRNVQEIIRSEVSLAKAEIREEASKAFSATMWTVAGALAALFAGLFLLWTIVFALSLMLPMWGAALVVTAVLAMAASVLSAMGVRRFKRVHPTPERTVETIKENVGWVRQSSK